MKTARIDGADWIHRPQQSIALGCFGCHLLVPCGGLQVDGAATDCQRFCCRKRDCKIVCFNSPGSYAKRLYEVGGLLSTI